MPGDTGSQPSSPWQHLAMIRNRIRLRFSKLGDLRFIGHRDLVRTLTRLFRRAGFKLSLTEGFHPKPRIHFPAALAVGVAATDEVVELELAEEMTAEEVLAAVRGVGPEGLEFLSAKARPAGSAKAELVRARYQVDVPRARCDGLAERIAWYRRQTTFPIWRQGRRKATDIRPFVEELVLDDGQLTMLLQATRQGSARPREVLDALQLVGLEREGCVMTRTEVTLRS